MVINGCEYILAPSGEPLLTDVPVLGLAGDFQQLTIYRSVDLYNNRFSMIALQVNAAWGWCIFAINTLLTGSILGKIM